MSIPSSETGPTTPLSEERPSLAAVFTEEFGAMQAEAAERGIQVGDAVAEVVIEDEFVKAEAALGAAYDQRDRVREDTRTTLLSQVGALAGGLLARKQTQIAQEALAATNAELAAQRAELADVAEHTRGLLLLQVALGARRLHAQLQTQVATAELGEVASAVRKSTYAQGWAASKVLLSQISEKILDEELADKRTLLDELDKELARKQEALHAHELQQRAIGDAQRNPDYKYEAVPAGYWPRDDEEAFPQRPLRQPGDEPTREIPKSTLTGIIESVE